MRYARCAASRQAEPGVHKGCARCSRARSSHLTHRVSRTELRAAGLQAATAAAALAASRVRRDGRHILNAANLEASACQRAQRRLGTRPGRLGFVAARCAHLNVQSGDAELLALSGDILRGKHGSIRGRLVTVRLHLHATRDLADRLLARLICYVHERVVKRRVDVRHRKHVLALLGLHAKRDRRRLLGNLLFLLGCHGCTWPC
mmetsp:Transcript_1430/g.3686  ORF Transcript_1430/g.3686 Transcript_1430/m.3686 type:complete len:204 (+) Transcript_1430:176-787(+)